MGRSGRGRGRPKTTRKVALNLGTDYFKPVGIPMLELETIVITLEEVEALRLVDFEGLEQEDAAKKMAVSRKTLWRELQSARKKIADALINGKAIQIKGGTYKMVGRGRMGGFGLGPSGDCVCSKCGHKESHERGEPCYQKKCSKCGADMTRT